MASLIDPYDLNDIMARLPVLQKAAFDLIDVKCDAVAFWPYQQESFPYWFNRLDGAPQFETSLAGDLEVHRYTVSMALVIGHIKEGYQGQPMEKVYRWIPAVLAYFRDYGPRHLYDGSEYRAEDEPRWLWTARGGAVITGAGVREIDNSGIAGVRQVAVVFTLEIPLLFETY